MRRLISLLLTLSAMPGFSAAGTLDKEHLQLTAIVSSKQGYATFECWELTQPATRYPTIGKTLPGFAQVSNVSYVVLPPRSSEGLHNAPHAMLFVLLSGLAHVTVLSSREELWIMEGANSVVIAADAQGVGHWTDYPSDKETVALQIPFAYGRLPEHRVVRNGVCGAGTSEGGVPTVIPVPTKTRAGPTTQTQRSPGTTRTTTAARLPTEWPRQEVLL